MILPANTPSFLGTLPGWITAFSGTGILAVMLKFAQGWRTQSLAKDSDIRDHYAKEVARLTEKLDNQTKGFRDDIVAMEETYRRLLEDSEKRHEECQRDRDRMREEMREMHKENIKMGKEVIKTQDELAGLRRQIARYSTDRLLVLTEDQIVKSAPSAVRSAKRLKTTHDLRDEGDTL